MTQDEIIEMARQAGFVDYELDDGTSNAFDKRYKVFASLVAQKTKHRIFKRAEIAAELAIEHAIELEREACAKIVDENIRFENYLSKIIRSRGQA